jgi:hypothetical protein
MLRAREEIDFLSLEPFDRTFALHRQFMNCRVWEFADRVHNSPARASVASMQITQAMESNPRQKREVFRDIPFFVSRLASCSGRMD